MSFLAPLFFAMGVAAGLPILFHLIRQRPKQTVPFSSLMFLQPNPPRLSRRKRIEDWFLLLLRMLVLLAIALAFTRPFLRSQSSVVAQQTERVVVFVVDRSASMRRDGVWESASETLQSEVARLSAQELAAVIAFDSSPEIIVSLESFAQNRTAVADFLRDQKPSWGAGDLGAALVMAAGVIQQFADAKGTDGIDQRVVIISDLQSTSDLSALRAFAWPAAIQMELRVIEGKNATNASIGVLADSDGSDAQSDGLRVRITNSDGAEHGQFQCRWIDSRLEPINPETETVTMVTVPAGSTKVLRVENPPPEAVAIELVGDDESFDNRYWVVGVEPKELQVLYLGSTRLDPREDLFYFLQRVNLDSSSRTIRYRQIDPMDEAQLLENVAWIADDPEWTRRTPLIVVHDLESRWTELLKTYVDSGGHLLWVLDSINATDASVLAGLRQISGDDRVQISPSPTTDYRLLGQIRFNDPLFMPFADPRFADFSKIQFWQTQRLLVDEAVAISEGEDSAALKEHWNIVARFDDGTIAIAKRRVGAGQISVVTAGWQPSESQLALSTKFVPLMSGWIGQQVDSVNSPQMIVGQNARDGGDGANEFVLQQGMSEDGAPVSVVSGDQLEIPGVYRATSAEAASSDDSSFVVNIDPVESSSGIYDQETLEQYGLTFTDRQRELQKATLERQMQDRELEEQQQWWRALLLFALGVLGLETLLGLRRRNSPNVEAGVPATS